MKKKLLFVLMAVPVLLAGCGEPPTPAEQFGIDELSKPAWERVKANDGMSVQDACQTEVDALPKEKLGEFSKDEVVKGCVRGNASDE